MKKTRELLALALAMMMALSCMVMPAMAAGDEDEGIMPLYEVGRCPYCGVSGRITRESYTHTTKKSCEKSSNAHKHTERYIFIDYTECGHTGGTIYDICGLE